MSEQFCIFQNLDCVKSGLTEGMMFNERFRMMAAFRGGRFGHSYCQPTPSTFFDSVRAWFVCLDSPTYTVAVLLGRGSD